MHPQSVPESAMSHELPCIHFVYLDPDQGILLKHAADLPALLSVQDESFHFIHNMGKRFPPLLVYHYYFHTASSKDHKYNKAAGITRKEGFDKLLSEEEEDEEDNLGWRASGQYSLDLCSGMGMLLRQVQYKYHPILKFSCLIFVWSQH